MLLPPLLRPRRHRRIGPNNSPATVCRARRPKLHSTRPAPAHRPFQLLSACTAGPRNWGRIEQSHIPCQTRYTQPRFCRIPGSIFRRRPPCAQLGSRRTVPHLLVNKLKATPVRPYRTLPWVSASIRLAWICRRAQQPRIPWQTSYAQPPFRLHSPRARLASHTAVSHLLANNLEPTSLRTLRSRHFFGLHPPRAQLEPHRAVLNLLVNKLQTAWFQARRTRDKDAGLVSISFPFNCTAL